MQTAIEAELRAEHAEYLAAVEAEAAEEAVPAEGDSAEDEKAAPAEYLAAEGWNQLSEEDQYVVQWTAISYQQSIKHLENLAELSTEPRAVNAIRRWERLEYDQQKVTVIQWRIGTADGRDFCNKN